LRSGVLASNRFNAVAMISSDRLRFCFALSPGAREVAHQKSSIRGSGVSRRRFNSWSSFTSSLSVIEAFSEGRRCGWPRRVQQSRFLCACRLDALCGDLGQDLLSYPV
jgi:hypothetical protein